jgi:peptidoglycan endopeptidase LytE
VVEGDTLDSIAAQFNVNVLVLMALNNMTESLIRVGDELLIPNPDLALDTPTPIPTGWRGTIEYRIAVGDTLELIAQRYFSTVESIMEENEIDNANEILVGQIIVIRVNIATPVPTSTPRPTILTPSPTP